MTELQQQSPLKKKHRFRTDIEGLRAVAVVLVILNHLGGFPAGGYIGVDVFFVISGYLITSQLVREQVNTGWISLGAFYARRLRRIVPVATLVALVIILIGYLIWFLPQANQTALDGMSALFWVANWHFAGVGTDYLQSTGPASPFQHYWSLSVEEQFYIFWPWLIIGCSLLSARRLKTSPQSALLLGVLAVAVASFLWSLSVTQWRPALAYFDTFGRAWEFAVGAVLAIAPLKRWTNSRAWTRWLPLLGVIVIAGGAVLLNAESSFPGPWAVVPVLGAALVIGGNERDDDFGHCMMLLSNPVARYLGRISYSLYLWHFPVIVFFEVIFPSRSITVLATMCLVMIFLSHLSYRYVELPMRQSGFLRSWEKRVKNTASSSSRVRQMVTSGALAAFIAVLTATQLVGPDELTDAAAARNLVAPSETARAAQPFESERALSAALQQGVASPHQTETLTPSLNNLGSPQQAPAMNAESGCRNTVGTTRPELCRYGSDNAPKTAVVIGDSIAMSWMPTVTAALMDEGWQVVGLGYASCSPYDIDTLPRNAPSDFVAECREHKKEMLEKVEELAPDLVIVSSGHGELANGSTGAEASAAWQKAVERTVSRLARHASAIAILPAPPYGPDMRECAHRIGGTAECVGSPTDEWKSRSAAEAKGLAVADKQNRRTIYVPAERWFCTPEGVCPPVVDGYVVRTDAVHLTNAYAESLAEVATPYFLGDKVS